LGVGKQGGSRGKLRDGTPKKKLRTGQFHGGEQIKGTGNRGGSEPEKRQSPPKTSNLTTTKKGGRGSMVKYLACPTKGGGPRNGHERPKPGLNNPSGFITIGVHGGPKISESSSDSVPQERFRISEGGEKRGVKLGGHNGGMFCVLRWFPAWSKGPMERGKFHEFVPNGSGGFPRVEVPRSLVRPPKPPAGRKKESGQGGDI